MLDLLIKGGAVVTPFGVGQYDVGIKDGSIAFVSVPGTITEEAGRTIDATDKLVVPGGIDPHTHCAWPVMQEKDGEPLFSGGPAQVSRAALFGGTTMLVDFAVWQGQGTIQETIERHVNRWTGDCHTDFAFHIMLLGEVPGEVVGQLPEAIADGHASVKMFTTNVTPSRRGRKVHYGNILEVLQTLAANGGIAAIHAEDDDLVMHTYDRYIDEGKVAFPHMPEVHSTLSEDLSFRRIIRLAESIEGAALYMMHVSAASGVQAIRESRARGYPIFGETLHQYALFTLEDYKRTNGQIYHTYPSLKSEEDRLALWRGMETDTIHTIGTDEICTPLEVKTTGERIDDTTGGNAGVEPRMGVIYSEAVGRRNYSLERFVDLTSANAAKVLGMYPQKGAIAPGSDADIAIFQTGLDYSLSLDQLHETDYSPWEGARIHGWPVTTILRGKVVVDDGEFFGETSDGKLVPRKLAQSVLEGRC
ncbi:MAG: amidohydrolase family protein [Propionibacteriales bacterium]|nr:amidohydrolase family protein [Propionibacteriales bacterium]